MPLGRVGVCAGVLQSERSTDHQGDPRSERQCPVGYDAEVADGPHVVEADHRDGRGAEEDQADPHDDAAVQFEDRHHDRRHQRGRQADLDAQQGVPGDDEEDDPWGEREQQLQERHDAPHIRLCDGILTSVIDAAVSGCWT